MAKKKIDINVVEDIDNFEDMAMSIGGDVLDNLEGTKKFIDTGVLALNMSCSGRFCGGGVPQGSIIEIFGESSTCKSLFACNCLTGAQRANGIAAFIDAEDSLSKEFASTASGLNPKKTIIIGADKVETLEKGFAKIHTIIRTVREKIPNERPILIVYDSIASSPGAREFAATTVEEDATPAELKAAGGGVAQPGDRAKVVSTELRKLIPVLKKNNTSVIFINQVRSAIGQLWGDPDVTTTGRAMKFYSALRLKTRASKRLKDELENVIGIRVSTSNVKNKCFKPFVDVHDMFLFFDQGIAPFSGLLDLLIRMGRITGSNGNYVVKEPFAKGKEIKFKASKERNDVPQEVLLECPQLVDANGKSEIEYYINNFNKATVASTNSTLVEQDITKEKDLDY